MSSNEAWLYFPHVESHGDHRPYAIVRAGAGSGEFWALLDSGAFVSQVSRRRATGSKIDYKTLTSLQTTRLWDGSATSFHTVALSEVTLGESVEELVPSLLTVEPQGPPNSSLVLGASMLLRYDALCFAWKDRVLYLGELGPCSTASRLAASGAEIHPNLWGGPIVAVQMSNGIAAVALIDTGSPDNLCKAPLAEELAAEPFRFGDHSLLEARCNPDRVPITEDYPVDMVIGMETLWTFAAFGWELDPFRMYFVPREDGD